MTDLGPVCAFILYPYFLISHTHVHVVILPWLLYKVAIQQFTILSMLLFI